MIDMGLRFHKRIGIVRGLGLNLSKTGVSLTLGGRGASVNLRGGKITGNAGVPGTGLSYRERLDNKSGGGVVVTLLILIAVAVAGYYFSDGKTDVARIIKDIAAARL